MSEWLSTPNVKCQKKYKKEKRGGKQHRVRKRDYNFYVN